MTHEYINPDTLFESSQFGYTQAVKTAGATHVFCAGQTAWDTELNIVGAGDFTEQTRKALENVGLALRAAGATPRDVVALRIYVVDHDMEKLPIIGAALHEFFGSANLPANTLIGVERLALPDFMIEMEATAIID